VTLPTSLPAFWHVDPPAHGASTRQEGLIEETAHAAHVSPDSPRAEAFETKLDNESSVSLNDNERRTRRGLRLRPGRPLDL
jgi:hypothetical protein